MGFLGYDKNEKLVFNFKKACGLWLMAVASVIAVGYLFPNISMVVIAYVDAAIKFAFGAYLYFFSRPSQQA